MGGSVVVEGNGHSERTAVRSLGDAGPDRGHRPKYGTDGVKVYERGHRMTRMLVEA
jgi:hypothetical protein